MANSLILKLNSRGIDVKKTQSNLIRLGLIIPKQELDDQTFGKGTQDALLAIQKDYRLPRTGALDDVTKAALAVATVGAEGNHPRVEGRIFFENGLPADGITLRLYNQGFGGAGTMLGEAKTREKGFYILQYDPGGKVANIEIRAVNDQGKEISLSSTKFNAGERELLNLVAPTSIRPPASEYQRLSASLKKQLGTADKLAEACERAERQDITLLCKATGWDARLIALAASAAKLSADTGISQEAIYGLLRAGLPSDKQLLSRIGLNALDKALIKAKESGIISLNDRQRDRIKKAFMEFSRVTCHSAIAPGTVSSFGNLLSESGITKEWKLTETERQDFEDIYFARRDKPGELWQKARDKDISEKKISYLRFQGKLSHLTLNNTALIKSLQEDLISFDGLATMDDQDIYPAFLKALPKMVDLELYQAQAWKERLERIAANTGQPIEKLIPSAYTGEKVDDRLEAYTADLARKVRLSFPTSVIRRMIEKDDLQMGNDQMLIHAFLKNAETLGFKLGRGSIDSLIRDHPDEIFKGIDLEHQKASIDGTKRLDRLYQITPNDESLKAAYKLGFNSSQDIIQFGPEVFTTRFGNDFPSSKDAKTVWQKAYQVHAMTFNLLVSARQLVGTPPLYATSPSAEVREEAKNKLTKHYPSMGNLFGSLDFCECEHCRSVLSPAAYFVDLLAFIDPNSNHYATTTVTNEEPLESQKTPYEVLIERRPDLPHLPLTCENTNTALPYIDIVNEIMEYCVANENLDEKAAKDTGAVTTSELLAEPQNIIPKAYKELKNKHYPLALPFDLWIETVREFLNHFETPLWKVLEAFSPSEGASLPTNYRAYDRAAILAEYLGISPDEYGIFTSPGSQGSWKELYGYNLADNASDELKSAKTLAQRLGISYKDLAAVVQTGFINPRLADLTIVWKLGFNVFDVVKYFNNRGKQDYTEEQNAFEERLKTLDENYKDWKLNAKSELENLWNSPAFKETLLLSNASGECNFDQTYLQYADGSRYAESLDLLKINLFVRLWKKLGWTIEETDLALQTFIPGNLETSTESKIGAALKLALVRIACLKALDEQVNAGKNSIIKLLTLWSHLPIAGENPLYAQLFLAPSILKNDKVFDNPMGNYLSKGDIFLKYHLLSIQAAINLTEDEIVQILEDAKIEIDEAQLNLDNISLLYRYVLLAKALKLNIYDFLNLKAILGIDPFQLSGSISLQPPYVEPVVNLADDYLFGQTLRFVEVANIIRQSSFQIEDINYLLRHRFNPVGKYRSNPQEYLSLVRALSSDLRRIWKEHAMPNSPEDMNDDLLRQKLILVIPPDAVEMFMGLWNESTEFSSVKKDVPEEDSLDPEKYEVKGIKVAFDSNRRQQSLSHNGVLTNAKKSIILETISAPDVNAPQNQKEAYSNFIGLLENIAIYSQSQAKGFFDKYFEGFLNYEDVFGAASEADKRKKVLEAFLPFLRQKLTHQLIIQALAASLKASPEISDALVTDSGLLSDPSEPVTSPKRALIDAFKAVVEQGVTMSLFSTSDLSSRPLEQAETADTINVTANEKINSALFRGYLEVPVAGAYRFYALLGKENAEAEFHIESQIEPIIHYKATKKDYESSGFMELKPGILYEFRLEVRNLQGGSFSLLVKGETTPKGSLSQLVLYPKAMIERVANAYLLIAKALQIIQGLGLSEREMRYILDHADHFDNFDLSKLPIRDADDTLEEAAALSKQFLRLLDYAQLKRDLAVNTDDLIAIMEKSHCTYLTFADKEKGKAVLPNELCELMAELTHRKVDAVMETAECLGLSTISENELALQAPHFAQEKGISRLWKALQIVEKLGVSTRSIVLWTNIISIEDAQEATDKLDIAKDLKNMVKARYEPENWRSVAQPIFDKLRQRQRDALVAYLLYHRGFESQEELFEHFLIDTGMEPVVQTSRLRQAISSVQLFIQRCLLNLEKEVLPSAINSKQWQWIKRYRIWEANRKIFLFPENWLEPEFRDDQTYLFEEFMSSLLQSDISNETAEDSFFKYLNSLKEIARLEIVSMYCEEDSQTEVTPYAPNTLHIIGRTQYLPHKYFYRRYSHHMWTPWEPVTAEIEGDHIVPVVWRNRLHLFWLTFSDSSETSTDETSTQFITDKNVVDFNIVELFTQVMLPVALKEVKIQLNWVEYYQGEWTSPQASEFSNSMSKKVPINFNKSWVPIHVSKVVNDDFDRAVLIHVGPPFDQSFRVVSKNSPPEIAPTEESLKYLKYPYYGNCPTISDYYKDTGLSSDQLPRKNVQFLASSYLNVRYAKEETCIEVIEDDTKYGVGFSEVTEKTIIGQVSDYHLAMCCNQPKDALITQFFYQDNLNAFFVEPYLFEYSIDRWEDWAISEQVPEAKLDDVSLPQIPIYPRFEDPVYQIPLPGYPGYDPGYDPRVNPIAELSRFAVSPGRDWVTSSSTIILFDNSLIGRGGGYDYSMQGVGGSISSPGFAEVTSKGQQTLGSKVMSSRGINIIGSSGLSSASLNKIKASFADEKII